jgi:hypothetical protein
VLTLVSASKADNPDSFAVFEGERCVGHIMRTQRSVQGKPWFWTIFVPDMPSSIPDRGYAATREQAMANFKAQWIPMQQSISSKIPPADEKVPYRLPGDSKERKH